MSDRGGPQEIPRPEKWRLADPPLWTPPDPGLSLGGIERVFAAHAPSQVVREHAVGRPPEPGRASAVLVSLYDSEDGPVTILTRRPLHMRKHAGEIAFPGGAQDDSDATVWHTALREAHEEVDLDPSVPRRIGELDRFVTGASFSLVTPIVAALPNRPMLRPSPDEVDAILHVSLAELMEPGVHRLEEWHWQGSWRPIHFFELVGDTIWGATALMLHNLLDVVGGAGPA